MLSLDGSTLGVPDASADDLRLGLLPVTHGEKCAHLRPRWAVLGEVGTHALVGPKAGSYHRLVTTLLDPSRDLAKELAALQAERWREEISIKLNKVNQGRPTVARGGEPRRS